MSRKQIYSFEVKSPEQAVEIFCSYVVTFASRLYADKTPTGGEPIEATKAELLESLKSIENDNRLLITLGRGVLKTGLYKDTVLDVLSTLTGLGAALSGATLAIRRTDDPKAINEAYDKAVGQGQEYRKQLTALSACLCERMYAGLATRPPLGKIAGMIYEKLKTLPEHRAMHIQEISNYLDDILDEVPPDNDTLRKRHLTQLEPYGIENIKRIGYYLR